MTIRTGSTNQPYQFVGKLGYYTHCQDVNLALVQLGVRSYDPEIGRFTQQDSAGDGVNWYLYANGRPLTMVDPQGAWAAQAATVGGTLLVIPEPTGVTKVAGAVVLTGVGIGLAYVAVKDYVPGIIDGARSACQRTYAHFAQGKGAKRSTEGDTGIEKELRDELARQGKNWKDSAKDLAKEWYEKARKAKDTQRADRIKKVQKKYNWRGKAQ